MLHCLRSPEDFAAIGRPETMKWLHQPQKFQQPSFHSKSFGFSQSSQIDDLNSVLREIPNRSMKAENSWDNGLPGLGDFPTAGTDFRGHGMGFELPEIAGSSLEMGHSISRTSSCPLPDLGAATSVDGRELAGRNSVKKRKAEVALTEECKDQKIKRDEEEEESKIEEKHSEISPNASKVSGSPKPDYIHVRARRGQATDSHSLAERARREKISKKMKYLQDLVPGCNKITGKAGMLDEIINYVQSLQRQVEFLSLKLATMNPRTDFNLDTFLGKEFPAYVAAGFPTAAASSEMANLPFLQFQPVPQGITSCELHMPIDPPQSALQMTTSSSTSVPEMFTNSTSFSQVQPFTTWDTDLQSLYTGEFQ